MLQTILLSGVFCAAAGLLGYLSGWRVGYDLGWSDSLGGRMDSARFDEDDCFADEHVPVWRPPTDASAPPVVQAAWETS